MKTRVSLSLDTSIDADIIAYLDPMGREKAGWIRNAIRNEIDREKGEKETATLLKEIRDKLENFTVPTVTVLESDTVVKAKVEKSKIDEDDPRMRDIFSALDNLGKIKG